MLQSSNSPDGNGKHAEKTRIVLRGRRGGCQEEMDYLQGVDTLIVNALRQKPHHSHQTLDEAVDFARLIGARQTWLIHSSHDIGRHAEVNASLPSDIQMAYDGQVIEIK